MGETMKVKTIIATILIFIAVVAVGFMITSLSLATEHGKTLTDEWKSWTAEETQEVEDEENSETELNTNNVENYSDIELVA